VGEGINAHKYHRKEVCGSANLLKANPVAGSVSFAGTRGLFLTTLVAQDGLSGELNLVALLANAFHHDLLPFFQFIAHILDPAVSNL